MALLPGTTTTSAPATSAGSLTHRTDTPGSQASASTSVELEIRGSRTAATRSHWLPIGGAGRPTTPWASTDSESSASSQNSSA